MIATQELELTDLNRQRRYRTALTGDITPEHTVDQVVHTYLERMRLPSDDVRWIAFSRGVRLDGKSRLAEIPDSDSAWTVLPEVSAGSR